MPDAPPLELGFHYASIGKRLVNNVNGIAYYCKSCDVRGLAPNNTILACWCCEGTNLRTRVNLELGGTTPYRGNAPQELLEVTRRSDDN